jgi:predicted Zn-dependent peptidase
MCGINCYKFEIKNCISKIRTMRLITSLLFLSIYCSNPLLSQRPTETVPLGSTLLVKLGNDMNLILMPIATTGTVEMTFYIKTGSMYETDSIHGIATLIQTILSSKISGYLSNSKNQVNAQNTVFAGSTNSEQSIFKFVTGNGSIATCMALMRDSVFGASFSKPEIASARNTMLQAIEDARHDAKKVFQQKMLNNLYTQDHARLEPLGDINNLRGIDVKAIKAFYQKYYVPNNTLATITGNINQTSVQVDIQNNLAALIKSEFDPETVTKFHGLRPMAYTTQFIVGIQ